MIWAEFFPQLVAVLSSVSLVGFSGIKTLLHTRDRKRTEARKKLDKIAGRADRDHARTLKGDPRGMYGNYTPPREFVEIADDDQFIDEWDKCELCPKRGRAHALSDHGKKLGTGGFPPVAVWSGTAEAPVEPMRLCAICYRECAYGATYRLNEALPVPMPTTFMKDLAAWLDAEGTWIEAVQDWLEAEKNTCYIQDDHGFCIKNHQTRPEYPSDYSNVTSFQAAAKRLGREHRQQLAVGEPTPAAQLDVLQKLQQAGILDPAQAWGMAARIAVQNAMFSITGIPDSSLFDFADALPKGPGCDLCEQVFTHGSPTPTRLHCSGLCQKRG